MKPDVAEQEVQLLHCQQLMNAGNTEAYPL